MIFNIGILFILLFLLNDDQWPQWTIWLAHCSSLPLSPTLGWTLALKFKTTTCVLLAAATKCAGMRERHRQLHKLLLRNRRLCGKESGWMDARGDLTIPLPFLVVSPGNRWVNFLVESMTGKPWPWVDWRAWWKDQALDRIRWVPCKQMLLLYRTSLGKNSIKKNNSIVLYK